jgi:uncharacterized protein
MEQTHFSENPVRWFEIYVQDIDKAKAFYEGVLCHKLEKLDAPGMDMWVFPMSQSTPGSSGALVKMEDAPSGGNSVLIYFGCADCSVEASRVPTYGGRIHKEKMSIGQYGFIALAFDPDGNMFGLHSME